MTARLRQVRRQVGEVHKAPPHDGQSLPRYGSAGLVNKANATNALPTKNFQRATSTAADAVSGETLTETQLIRNSGCVSCPIRCERRVPVDGRNLKGPEYETLGFFGPNIEAADMDTVLRMNWLCDIYGVDTISFASSLASPWSSRNGAWRTSAWSSAGRTTLRRCS